MAHAIIFVDRAPQCRQDDSPSQYYTHSAGAYKIASVLREMGLDVLVVPNCLNLTFSGIKNLINKHKENLLWVGLATTFFLIQQDPKILDLYRKEWTESDSNLIDADLLANEDEHTKDTYPMELPWGNKQIHLLSDWLEKTHKIPFIIGGVNSDKVMVTHKNTHCVLGYAEKWIKEFTLSLKEKTQSGPPIFMNNSDYDDTAFKQSKILWRDHDMVEPDSWLPLEVARGCAFNCAYCNFDRKNSFDSYKHYDVLREELIENYEKYGVTRYLLIDDLYNDSKDKVRILYDKVWSRLPFKPEWASYLRLDMIWSDPDSAQIIMDSGCRYGSFGIETLHDVAGRRVGKGLGKQRIIETLEHLKKVWGQNTLVGAFFIAGLPYEPIESIKETLEWSLTTDLLHGPKWNPMFLSPPNMTNRTTPMQADHTKYGITWLDQYTWINSEGITQKMCVDLLKDYALRLNPWQISFHLSRYVDMRVAGFTHEQIANWRNSNTAPDLQEKRLVVKDKINQRLEKILNIPPDLSMYP